MNGTLCISFFSFPQALPRIYFQVTTAILLCGLLKKVVLGTLRAISWHTKHNKIEAWRLEKMQNYLLFYTSAVTDRSV